MLHLNVKLMWLCLTIGWHQSKTNAYSFDTCDKFFMTIENEPEFFVPQSSYIVGVESNSLQTFTSFQLTADSINDTQSKRQVGWFTLMPEEHEAQFDPDSINTIMEQDQKEKRSIYVLWTAPSSHNCVLLRAKVTYRVNKLKCDQSLERQFCSLQEQTPNNQPSDECCPCDEASYTLIFEGLWSNETHPKYFPSALQLTHFSDIVGCTHSKNVTMWAEGLYASEGLRQVAEFGSSSIMESELLEKRKHLRSLVKVAGLWYPRMNSNTTSSFRVDKRHNLLSLAAMLGPSPDWFTGISNLNLCTKNCSWVENKIVDLSLYDAGTDSGITYMSPNAPTFPQERIYRITSSYPEDPRAPFYNMNGEDVKPIARLYLRRDSVVKKSCIEEPMFDPDQPIEESENDKRLECATMNYTDWSPCSATCGKGLNIRTRKYIDQKLAIISNCNRQLMQKKVCMVDVSCPGEPQDNDPLAIPDEHCKTTEWSEWSECTATCGIGFMTRTRQFLRRSGFKKCKHISILEKKKCMEPPCKTKEIKTELTNCTTTEWSDWSPCTATCGKGLRIRIRHLIVPANLREFCKTNITLEERRDCIRTADCIVNKVQAKEVCQLPKEKGLCRGEYQRWYYNLETKQCTEFSYGGCRGNRNNFLTLDECIKTCSGLFTE